MTASLERLLKDDRYWCGVATVALHDGESTHWEVDEQSGQIMLSVVMNQGLAQVTAILNGYPDWSIPAIGTEVKIGFTDGDYEGDAFVISRHSPSPTGVGPDQHLVVEKTIELRGTDLVQMDAATIKVGKNAVDKMLKGTGYVAVESTFLASLTAMSGALGVYTAALLGYAPLAAVLTAGGATSPASVWALALSNFEAAISAFSGSLNAQLAVKGEVE